MNSNLKRRIERLERAVGVSGGDDPRAYTYPNGLAEMFLMGQMTDQQLQEHLRTRKTRPSAETCDQFDALFEKLKATENNQKPENMA